MAMRGQTSIDLYDAPADQAERHRRTLQELIRHHEQRAEELMTDEPKGTA